MHKSILLVVCTYFVSAQSQFSYDCQRMDDCQNDRACNTIDGTCWCADDFLNYNCGVNATLSECASNTCQNNGLCYVVDSTDTCFCPYGYYGDTCEQRYVQLTCTGDTAEFAIVLPPQFSGQVSLVNGNNEIDSECIVNDTEDGNNTKYSIIIDISPDQDTAGVPCKINNVANLTDTVTTYRTSLMVAYRTGITTSLDEIYFGDCIHTTESEVSQNIGSIAFANENLTVNEFEEVYSTAALVVADVDLTPLAVDSNIYVGTIFNLIVYLTDTSVYKTVRFDNCVANNTLPAPDEKTFSIMDLGCPTQGSKYITQGQSAINYTVGDTDLPASILPVEAFKFSDSQTIGILCTTKICKDGDDSCEIPADCEAVRNQANSGAQRKKRAAGDDVSDNVDLETVSTTLTIHGPNDVSDQSGQASGMEQLPVTLENCFDRSDILAVVAVLAGFVCILLIACLVLGCMLIKRRAKSVEFEAMPAPPSERFRIPRAHVNDSFSLREI
ncbi:Neurogenic locus notch protein 1 [Mactra antiquata]